jgi:hypothetical protein
MKGLRTVSKLRLIFTPSFHSFSEKIGTKCYIISTRRHSSIIDNEKAVTAEPADVKVVINADNVTAELDVKVVTKAKKTIPVKFTIDEKDIEEKFVRGSGPGGQKINKSRNKVYLLHIPTGVTVNCQDQRDLTSNRKIGRKWLTDKVDLFLNKATSKLEKKYEKIRKRKSKASRRASKKYHGNNIDDEKEGEGEGEGEGDEEEEEEEEEGDGKGDTVTPNDLYSERRSEG